MWYDSHYFGRNSSLLAFSSELFGSFIHGRHRESGHSDTANIYQTNPVGIFASFPSCGCISFSPRATGYSCGLLDHSMVAKDQKMLAKIRDVNSLRRGTGGHGWTMTHSASLHKKRPSWPKTYPIWPIPQTPHNTSHSQQMVSQMSQSQASACLSAETISRLRRSSGSLVDVRS